MLSLFCAQVTCSVHQVGMSQLRSRRAILLPLMAVVEPMCEGELMARMSGVLHHHLNRAVSTDLNTNQPKTSLSGCLLPLQLGVWDSFLWCQHLCSECWMRDGKNGRCHALSLIQTPNGVGKGGDDGNLVLFWWSCTACLVPVPYVTELGSFLQKSFLQKKCVQAFFLLTKNTLNSEKLLCGSSYFTDYN